MSKELEFEQLRNYLKVTEASYRDEIIQKLTNDLLFLSKIKDASVRTDYASWYKSILVVLFGTKVTLRDFSVTHTQYPCYEFRGQLYLIDKGTPLE